MAKGFAMKTAHLLTLLASLIFTFAAPSVQAQDSSLFRHVVCFEFKENTTEHQYMEVIGSFMELKNQIDTIVDIEWGTTENIEPLNDGFTHIFFVTFKDKAGLETYLPHPAHEEFKTILKPHLKKVFVFDYTPQE